MYRRLFGLLRPFRRGQAKFFMKKSHGISNLTADSRHCHSVSRFVDSTGAVAGLLWTLLRIVRFIVFAARANKAF